MSPDYDEAVGRCEGTGVGNGSLVKRAWAVSVLATLVVLAGCSQNGGENRSGSDRTVRPSGGADSTTTVSSRPSTTTATTVAPTTTTTVPPPPEVRALDLRRTPFRLLCPDGPVRVSAGAGGQSASGRVTLESFDITYAELTGDGQEDALVAATCVLDQGNAYVASIAVVRSETAGPVQVGDPVEGFDPVVVGGRPVVTRSVYADDDPRCCPSATAYVPLSLAGGSWREGGGGTPPSTGDRATTTGLGPLRIGTSFAELAGAVGETVEVSDPAESDGSCVYVSVSSLGDRVHGLGGAGRLRSLEVDDSAIRTQSGLGIGSTEVEVQAAFPGKILVEPHEYTDGHYLLFRPNDGSGAVVFETDGITVTRYRLGDPAFATALEGCA